MGNPIGKLILYTACAGVPPEYTLPVMLDLGNNNEEFLSDPLYPGIKERRAEGLEYDEFIDEFVEAITQVFPKIRIQWEDFNGNTAVRILEKFRDRICTFNGDIQGTAAIAIAGFIAISRLLHKPFSEQKSLLLGAGVAAFGIAEMIVQKLQKDGLSKSDALSRVHMFDINGLLVASRNDMAEF